MFCRHVFGNISGGFGGTSRFFGNFAGFRGNTWISRVRDCAKYQKPCLLYTLFGTERLKTIPCPASHPRLGHIRDLLPQFTHGIQHLEISRESFRFWDKDDYDDKIFSIPSIAHAWTSVILAWKCSSRRHSTTSFSKNVVVAETSYQK